MISNKYAQRRLYNKLNNKLKMQSIINVKLMESMLTMRIAIRSENIRDFENVDKRITLLEKNKNNARAFV